MVMSQRLEFLNGNLGLRSRENNLDGDIHRCLRESPLTNRSASVPPLLIMAVNSESTAT